MEGKKVIYLNPVFLRQPGEPFLLPPAPSPRKRKASTKRKTEKKEAAPKPKPQPRPKSEARLLREYAADLQKEMEREAAKVEIPAFEPPPSDLTPLEKKQWWMDQLSKRAAYLSQSYT
jgi:hypothetical protein